MNWCCDSEYNENTWATSGWNTWQYLWLQTSFSLGWSLFNHDQGRIMTNILSHEVSPVDRNIPPYPYYDWCKVRKLQRNLSSSTTESSTLAVKAAWSGKWMESFMMMMAVSIERRYAVCKTHAFRKLQKIPSYQAREVDQHLTLNHSHS